MKLNVSQLLEYQTCPVKWHHKYASRRGLPPYPGALSDGIYWHKLQEAYLKGEPLLPPSEGPQQDAMRAFVEEGNSPRIPVVAVERVLEMPLGRHTLVGTVDGIEPVGDKFYSLQWKTCAGGNDLERQCDAVKYSYHECAYETLMNYNGYPCAGTHLGVWKKLTKAERSAGVWPLYFYVLERDPAYVARIIRELELAADEMEAATTRATWTIPGEEGKWAPVGALTPHRRSCIIANMRCAYWQTCYEGLPLSDSKYVDLETRY